MNSNSKQSPRFEGEAKWKIEKKIFESVEK